MAENGAKPEKKKSFFGFGRKKKSPAKAKAGAAEGGKEGAEGGAEEDVMTVANVGIAEVSRPRTRLARTRAHVGAGGAPFAACSCARTPAGTAGFPWRSGHTLAHILWCFGRVSSQTPEARPAPLSPLSLSLSLSLSLPWPAARSMS